MKGYLNVAIFILFFIFSRSNDIAMERGGMYGKRIRRITQCYGL